MKERSAAECGGDWNAQPFLVACVPSSPRRTIPLSWRISTNAQGRAFSQLSVAVALRKSRDRPQGLAQPAGIQGLVAEVVLPHRAIDAAHRAEDRLEGVLRDPRDLLQGALVRLGGREPEDAPLRIDAHREHAVSLAGVHRKGG